MGRRTAWGIACVSLLLATAATARAADDVALRDAQARFEEGLARVKAGDREGALVSFSMAYAIVHKPAIVWNLAVTEEKTKRPVEALRHFREYLHVAPSGDADRERAMKHIDELNAITGHIDVAAPAGTAIAVDATLLLGLTPLSDVVDVAPGHHSVEARFAGQVKTVDVDAVAGKVARAEFGEWPAAAGAPDGVAGQPTGGTPEPQTEPAPPQQDVQPTPSTSPARILTVVAVGAGAVIVGGVALGFGVASNNNAGLAGTLRQQNPDCSSPTLSNGCQQLASTTSAQHNDHVVSTDLWLVAGGIAAADVALFFLWPKRAGSGGAAVSVAPAVGPRSAGLSAVGSF
jgi:hypothetical protein